MKLFDVYKMMPLALEKANNYYVYDEKGQEYLDFYGGHAVISIGHNHPHYVAALTEQLQKIGYYSNAVGFPLRDQLAKKLGEVSGYEDYNLFLCNSGAEAMENALKIASFHTGKRKLVAFSGAFHGRTSAALSISDNPKIKSPLNSTEDGDVVILEPENAEKLEKILKEEDICAVVIEGIRGVGGIYMPSTAFLQSIEALCKKYNVVFICDEIQSGYGRTGKFFAHQHAKVQPDLIAVAKGMGNGFPVAGVLIHPKFEAKLGMLGTTFGGNPLACAAAIAVLEVIEKEKLLDNAAKVGTHLKKKLQQVPGITAVSGKGLMLGCTLSAEAKIYQQVLVEEEKVLVGSSSDPYQIRLLPPLTIDKLVVDLFISKLINVNETLLTY